MTLEKMGLYEMLSTHNQVFWHHRMPEGKTSKEVRLEANAASIYITSVNYHSDSEGTQLNYEVLSEAICAVRCSTPLGADWKKRIDEDYKARKDGKRK